MKNDNLPGLSPIWLIGLALALGVFLSVALPALVSTLPVNTAAWLGFAGSVTSGSVAAIAIYVAVRNVRNQLQVSLIGREEERIEAALPGLKQLAGYLGTLVPIIRKSKPAAIAERIGDFIGIVDEHDNWHDKFDEAFRLTDQATREQLRIILEDIIRSSRLVANDEKQMLNAMKRLEFEKENKTANIEEARSIVQGLQVRHNLHMLVYRTGLHALEAFQDPVRAKIEISERRLIRFRQKVEEYFDD